MMAKIIKNCLIAIALLSLVACSHTFTETYKLPIPTSEAPTAPIPAR